MKTILMTLGFVTAISMIGIGGWMWHSDRNAKLWNKRAAASHDHAEMARLDERMKGYKADMEKKREVVIEALIELRGAVARCETESEAWKVARGFQRYAEKVSGRLPEGFAGKIPSDLVLKMHGDHFMKWKDKPAVMPTLIEKMRSEAASVAAEIDAAMPLLR
jgi:hypothetical protein